MPPTASELEAVLIPRKDSGDGNGGGKKRVVDGPAMNEERKTYPLGRDVVEGASANVSWERLDVLDYIRLGHYLNAEHFSVLSAKGRDFCINTTGLIKLTARGMFIRRGRR